MKIVGLLVVLLAASCSAPSENPSTDDALSKVPESTDYQFPKLKIPATFYFDSISVYDSTSQATYNSHFLQSTLLEMKVFNNKITEVMKDRIQWERSYVDPCDGSTLYECGYTFVLRPTVFYSSKDVISITHVVDTYGAGGNHHNYSWLTFNFDLKRNEQIHFRNVFNLPSRKDSIAFAASVRENSVNGDSMGWDVPFDSVDFSFTDNGMYINPDLSWACAQNRSLLPMDSLRKYLEARGVAN